MPHDETITTFGDRLVALARRNILERGGSYREARAASVYRIRTELARNIEPILDRRAAAAVLRTESRPLIEAGVAAPNIAEMPGYRVVHKPELADLTAESAGRSQHPRRW